MKASWKFHTFDIQSLFPLLAAAPIFQFRCHISRLESFFLLLLLFRLDSRQHQIPTKVNNQQHDPSSATNYIAFRINVGFFFNWLPEPKLKSSFRSSWQTREKVRQRLGLGVVVWVWCGWMRVLVMYVMVMDGVTPWWVWSDGVAAPPCVRLLLASGG